MMRIVHIHRSRYSPQGGMNPLVRLAAGVVSALVLLASAFLGFFIFLAVLGVLAVAATVMAFRLWLFRRRVEAALRRGASQDPRDKGYIDAEYEERGTR